MEERPGACAHLRSRNAANADHAFLGSDWQGTAAGSHESPWADWEDGARRVIASFTADAGALRSAAGGYGSAQAIVRAGSSPDLPEVP